MDLNSTGSSISKKEIVNINKETFSIKEESPEKENKEIVEEQVSFNLDDFKL